MDNTPHHHDSDYARHVKLINESDAQREHERQADQQRDEWLAKNPHRDHEGFATFLGIAAAIGVAVWINSSYPGTGVWEQVLIIGGTLFGAGWFFQKYRLLTKAIGLVIAGGLFLWLIATFYS